VGIHLRYFLGKNSFEGVQKLSQRDHLQIYLTRVGMLILKSQMKVQGSGLVCNLLKKVENICLIQDAKW
jgi:hypothetical protein